MIVIFSNNRMTMNTNNALILTDGFLDQLQSKTAHGLIFGASRYHIVGVIDKQHADKDAGMVVMGVDKQIPVFASMSDALQRLERVPDYCVIGVAPVGGALSETLIKTILAAIDAKINIVSGLHSLLCDHPLIALRAKEKGVRLIDIRKPKPAHELPMWTGKIGAVKTPRITVIGMDCAIGKRTTAGMLKELCQAHGIKAEMIYTGQTGWLQNMSYGFILDSTLNDFVAGEVEHAILTCVAEANPELIFIEGQSALRNPAGPCGAELLCSAGAQYAILQHSPGRMYYTCDTTHTYKIPDITDEIALVKYYGASVIAITLNSYGIDKDELPKIKQELQQKTKLPVLCPREEGVNTLLPILKNIILSEDSHENHSY